MVTIPNSTYRDILSLCKSIDKHIVPDTVSVAEIKRRASKIKKKLKNYNTMKEIDYG